MDLIDKDDGDGDNDNNDDDNTDPRFKNLNQEYVAMLAAMGFPIEWFQFALAESNDIEAGTEWLLGHMDTKE